MSDAPRNQQFLTLFLRDEPRLYSVIRSLVFNDADADEILQETAAEMWRKFDQFDPATRFDRWANAFIRNKVMDYQRRRRSQGALFLSDQMLALLVDRSGSAAESHSQTLAALETCIDKLPDADRSLLKRRYEPGQSNRTIATETGRSESAISRSLNRIYGLLMDCIHRTLEIGT